MSWIEQHDQNIMKQLEGLVQMKNISWLARFENYLEQSDIFEAKVPISRQEVVSDKV